MVVLLIVSLLWSAADGAIVPSRMVLGVNTQLQQAARHDHAIHHQSHGCCPEPEPAPVPPMVLTAPAIPCAPGHVCCVRPGSGNLPTLPPGNADNRTQEAIPPASCSIVDQGHQIGEANDVVVTAAALPIEQGLQPRCVADVAKNLDHGLRQGHRGPTRSFSVRR